LKKKNTKIIQNYILIVVNYFIKLIFEIFNIKVLNNHLIGSVGHSIFEIDYFLLLKKNKKLEKKNYIIFLDNNSFCQDLKLMFKSKLNIVLGTKLNTIVKKFLQKNKKYSFDIGLGHFLNVPEEEIEGFGNGMRDWESGFQRTIDYWDLRNKDPNFFSFKGIDVSYDYKSDFYNKLGIKKDEKIALIHIKNQKANACAKPTDPETYHGTIEFLLSNNYKIILNGREEMPDSFKNYPIFNYAECNEATWLNDVILCERSDLNICFGSGIVGLSCVLDKPSLYIGFWHLFQPSPNKNGLFIPTLLKNKNTGKYLSFKEQIDFCLNSKKQVFNSEKLDAVNPSNQDILNGTKELIEIINAKLNISKDQINFNLKYGNIPLAKCQSHISENFLKKYNHLI
jgi:putative glycosyltransferase (TIGR04372 family)